MELLFLILTDPAGLLAAVIVMITVLAGLARSLVDLAKSLLSD